MKTRLSKEDREKIMQIKLSRKALECCRIEHEGRKTKEISNENILTPKEITESIEMITDCIEMLNNRINMIDSVDDDIKVGDRFYSEAVNRYFTVMKIAKHGNYFIKFDNDNRLIITNCYAIKNGRLDPDRGNRLPENIINLPKSGQVEPNEFQLSVLQEFINFIDTFYEQYNPQLFIRTNGTNFMVTKITDKHVYYNNTKIKNGHESKITWLNLLRYDLQFTFIIGKLYKTQFTVFEILNLEPNLNEPTLHLLAYELGVMTRVNIETGQNIISDTIYILSRNKIIKPIPIENIILGNIPITDDITVKVHYKQLFKESTALVRRTKDPVIQENLIRIINKVSFMIASKDYDLTIYRALRSEFTSLLI